MDLDSEPRDTFSQEDHQVAYVFDPDEDGSSRRDQRAPKRRRVTKLSSRKSGAGPGNYPDSTPLFMPFLNGGERPEFVRLRQRLFEESWGMVNRRIQGILRDSNSATLDQVSKFVEDAKSNCIDQIPSAFIITGPNIASQDLLFEQLSESLQRSSTSRFVRLKSSEALTLKAALKKTIRDATAVASNGEEGEELQEESLHNGRRYLDYDLEALQNFVGPHKSEHVFVALQDSEGFDSTLMSDLISLFHSWRPRIPFTLLFGIATSVELLQARLLKSAGRLIYGGQFDSVQTSTILETVFKGAIAASDVPLRLGAPLLRSMLDRQHEQVAGIQSFASSLKYAYMCHFYANPLSILCSGGEDEEILQHEHLEAVRNLPSFRMHVEREVEQSTQESLTHAKSLIENEEYLLNQVRDGHNRQKTWSGRFLRSLLIMQAAGALRGSFSKAYVDGMIDGADVSEGSGLVQRIRRMSADELAGFLRQVITVLDEGEPSLRLGPSTEEVDEQLQTRLQETLEGLEQLIATAEKEGITLRSKYSGQSKVMRTTVIAQKVQLSQDSARLREEDNQLTKHVDDVTTALSTHFPDTNPNAVLFAECWLYGSKSPSREVFVPRPRAAFERSLGRPHDYLACSCCQRDDDGLQATLPATAILYQLYLETGNLINVADLWTAFHGLVSQEEENERKVLVMFYKGLAEMRALGFVKSSKKKVDHIAKVKWL